MRVKRANDPNGQHLIDQVVYFKCLGWADNLFLNPYLDSSGTATASSIPEENVGGATWAKWVVKDSGVFPYVMLESMEKPGGKVYYLSATRTTLGGGYEVRAVESVNPEGDEMLHWKMDRSQPDQYYFMSRGVSNYCLRLAGTAADPDQKHWRLCIWRKEFGDNWQVWVHFRPHWTSGYQTVAQLQNDTPDEAELKYQCITGFSSMAGQSVTVGGGIKDEVSFEIKTFFTLGYEVELSGAWTEHSSTSFVSTTSNTITMGVLPGKTVELLQLTGTYSDFRVLGGEFYTVDVETGDVLCGFDASGRQFPVSEREARQVQRYLQRGVQEGGSERPYLRGDQAEKRLVPRVNVQEKGKKRDGVELSEAQTRSRDKMIGQIIYIRSLDQVNCFMDCDSGRSQAATTGHHPDTVGGAMQHKWEVVDMRFAGQPYVALRNVLQDHYYVVIENDVAYCRELHNPRDHVAAHFWMTFDNDTDFLLSARQGQRYLSTGNKIGSNPDKYDLVLKSWSESPNTWQVFTPANDSGFETVSFLHNNSSGDDSMEHEMLIGYEKEDGGDVEVGVDITVKFGAEVKGFFTSSRSLNFNAQWQQAWSQTFSTSRIWTVTFPVPPQTRRRLRQLLGKYDAIGVKSSYFILDEKDRDE